MCVCVHVHVCTYVCVGIHVCLCARVCACTCVFFHKLYHVSIRLLFTLKTV